MATQNASPATETCVYCVLTQEHRHQLLSRTRPTKSASNLSSNTQLMESNHGKAESDQYYPLTPIFRTTKDSAEELEWKKRFRHDFKVNPSQFKNSETKLEERCDTYSVDYISPCITDSVESTKDRKTAVAKKCKAAAERIKWANLSATEHNNARARMISNRIKKHSTNRRQA